MRLLLPLVTAAALWAQGRVQFDPDEESYQKVFAISRPAAQLAAIQRFVTQYPNSRAVPRMLERAFDDAEHLGGPWTAPRAVEFAQDLARRMSGATPMARSEAERTIALRLLARNLALHDAERYVRQAIARLNAEDHVTRERQWYRQKVDLATAREPAYQPPPFYPEEARERYRTVEATTWCVLGRILIRQGRDAEARQALQKSLAAARTADAAAAFAGLAAREGDTHTVLDALGTAILTGKADRPTRDKFYAAYGESGMRPSAEGWLDRRYRMEFRNPLQVAPFRAVPATPRRAVLLELVTGTDCEPCVSVDLASDALLHRYARQDLVLIAHHVQAGAAQRAPAVVLDGEPIEPGEGLASVTRPVFDRLDAAIQQRIAAPAQAAIQLQASWSGSSLHVEAAVEGPNGAKLQLYLVETEISYSGENGIRLHPMVIRSTARLEAGGFDVTGSYFHAEWTVAPGELRDPLNAAKLAVIAVVQDAGTRRVLQSAYLPVEAPHSAAQ